jgi:hypothetical protein
MAVGCGPDAAFECHGRKVVALVHDDEPVAVEHLSEVLATGKALQGYEIDDLAPPLPTCAELADLSLLQAKQVGKPLTALFSEGLGVYEHEGRRSSFLYESAGHDSLSSSRRGD